MIGELARYTKQLQILKKALEECSEAIPAENAWCIAQDALEEAETRTGRGKMKKVLVSPEYGAGFATWCTPGKFFAEHPKLIEAVENGIKLNYDLFVKILKEKPPNLEGLELYSEVLKGQHPVFLEVVQEAWDKFGEGMDVYWGGFNDCKVQEVTGRYYIKEYDGFETLVEEHDQEWW